MLMSIHTIFHIVNKRNLKKKKERLERGNLGYEEMHVGKWQSNLEVPFFLTLPLKIGKYLPEPSQHLLRQYCSDDKVRLCSLQRPRCQAWKTFDCEDQRLFDYIHLT